MRSILIKTLALNLTTGLLTLALLQSGFSLGVDAENAYNMGTTLTTLMLVFGIAGHINGRRGELPLIPIILLALPGPIYALIGGPLNHIIGFHVVCLGFTGLALRGYHVAQKKAESKEDTKEDAEA